MVSMHDTDSTGSLRSSAPKFDQATSFFVSYLEAAQGNDVTSPGLLNFLTVVSMHLEHTSHALGLSLYRNDR